MQSLKNWFSLILLKKNYVQLTEKWNSQKYYSIYSVESTEFNWENLDSSIVLKIKWLLME